MGIALSEIADRFALPREAEALLRRSNISAINERAARAVITSKPTNAIEWAAKNRLLDGEYSRYQPSLVPHFVEIARALGVAG